MTDEHYTDARLAALYDLDSGWSIDRDFYLNLAGTEPKRILDLGCGTGLLCSAYAELGHIVTGVDPAKAMLDIARQRRNGNKITWVEASAETLASTERYDLIVMTGNAFMTLLTEEAMVAALSAVRQHLGEGGLAGFECRNPAIDWPSFWNYEVTLADGEIEFRQTRRFLRMEGPTMIFEFKFALPDRIIATESRIRFSPIDDLKRHVETAGLKIRYLFGGWNEQPFDASRSENMIVIAERS